MKFKGRIEVLNAAVYDFISLLQPELYVCATREIVDYVGKTLKYYSSDAKAAIEHLELPVIPKARYQTKLKELIIQMN